MSTTSLGMPAVPPRAAAPSWRTAWDGALYGPEGFYRHQAPADHFRTALHDSDHVAAALLRLADRSGTDTVVDIGAGRGELLTALHRLAPRLRLRGVEVAPRPASLPAGVEWSPALPPSVDGLVVAHEWLDSVPCHVVQVDEDGTPRMVHVAPDGTESLGLAVDAPGVPPVFARWLAEWWPLGAAPGSRAELGVSRDRAWSAIVARIRSGVAVAVDYGHRRGSRPPHGSLRSYRHGRRVPVVPDGSCDITADVAVDSVAAAVGGTLLNQADALRALGVTADRPPVAMARTAPREYAAALADATRRAELLSPDCYGAFWWMVSAVGGASHGLGSTAAG